MARPLVHLREQRHLDLEVLDPTQDGRVPPQAFADALQRRAFRLVAFSHGSNVLGSVLDAAEICRIAHEHDAAVLMDASQTAGLLDLSVGADAVAASAHKSLLGPPGLGFLAVREQIHLRPSRFGGTGSGTALDRQPEEWPTGMEPGTPNTPAILGLAAALAFIAERGPAALLSAELAVLDTIRPALADRAVCHGPIDGPRLPVLSFNWDGLDPAEVGVILDGAGIHLRTGFHCAPWLHHPLGTAVAGTVRVSVGPFNSAGDIQAVTRALAGP
jgi:selenocysteine lyase/cysteine desulfurase